MLLEDDPSRITLTREVDEALGVHRTLCIEVNISTERCHRNDPGRLTAHCSARPAQEPPHHDQQTAPTTLVPYTAQGTSASLLFG